MLEWHMPVLTVAVPVVLSHVQKALYKPPFFPAKPTNLHPTLLQWAAYWACEG